ncbi:hypothetical protein [Metasolibacillus meyeri]|uniref:hypothetical protein n=1 Tax=Metasolibacillus meyeri TaxID=1071052 RepID=UPI000D31D766|nr:hypothetical protein [Metasolibacillus meyeri]
MTVRRNSLKVIDNQVFEGEVIFPEKRSTELQKQELENNHALNMRKMDAAMDVIEIGKQIVGIVAIRENSKAKINEIDAYIRQLEQATQHEVALLRQNRKTIESRGQVVAEILGKLTPLLANQHLTPEIQKTLIETFEQSIDKAISQYE